ncbi:hypothetical protein AcW2_006721 [Taiwanofungus camphoratus]|nr:hypothetical protein AcW2_006721 [Antrodia cinnamomea]
MDLNSTSCNTNRLHSSRSPPPVYNTSERGTFDTYTTSSYLPGSHAYQSFAQNNVPHERSPLNPSNIPGGAGGLGAPEDKAIRIGLCLSWMKLIARIALILFASKIIMQSYHERRWELPTDVCDKIEMSNVFKNGLPESLQDVTRNVVECRQRESRRKADERRRWGLFWDEPKPGKQCLAYDMCEYSARLWDVPFGSSWREACESMPFQIHNRTFDKPDHCDYAGIWGGVRGHWTVSERELACRTYWNDLEDMGCVSHGSGKRRFEAQLMNLRVVDDWLAMCSTTPIDILGNHFNGPKYCEKRFDRFLKAYVVGMWEYEDVNCL